MPSMRYGFSLNQTSAWLEAALLAESPQKQMLTMTFIDACGEYEDLNDQNGTLFHLSDASSLPN